MSVGDIANREERPPYVRFERKTMEDKPASLAAGRYVGKDIDFVIVTPAYSKDEMPYKYERFLENTEKNVRDGRMPEKWLEVWKDAYSKWKNGQEMPLHGTPIRGWGLISPAQQETLIHMNCMTVEDLAAINDEGKRRIGMGALELQNKAKNWLQAMNDHGPLTTRVTALERENEILKSQNDTLAAQLVAVKAQIPQPQFIQPVQQENSITANDLLEDEPVKIDTKVIIPSTMTPSQQYEAKFGKPPHHRMLPETILAKLKE
jgi:hypothetical protein